ncbi:TonB-dependent receptor [Pseudoduganella aquatica]|uniref:TonB-dependent receptor n=1 Tax=Pseudoduganella aquatica TaxID=2660641 RepID=A0A7X4H9I4_9BURK|nr:TonB-dependent receptor [Pseudoduganella aquatica]MYN06754.1 TonB-dependent receptor [Pseudoduganella aquatica]
MNLKKTPIAASVSIALLGLAMPVHAQTQAPAAAVQSVEVTGIRASLEKSINVKKNADSNIEVVTAEDIGKMPDKNIADSLSRLAGVNITYNSALAFDEAERIAIRGTPPFLNLTTLNGHSLSSGDWYIGDQNTNTRGISFGMLPSQLIGQAIVYKNGRADIVEGGIAGNVDIITRRPLDQKKRLVGEVSLGMAHSTLAGTTDPQLSGLLNWKNEAGTMGVLVQAFKEERHLRRDGQENFGQGQYLSTQAAADPTKGGDAALKGKRLPNQLNSAFFEGVRERQGGYVGLQFKPNSALDVNLNVFKSSLSADNYNTSAFAELATIVNNGGLIKDYTIVGDVITAATILPNPARKDGNTLQFAHQARTGAKSTAGYYDIDVKWKPTSTLTVSGKAGSTKGTGETAGQPGALYEIFDKGVTYKLNDDGRAPADWAVTGTDLSNMKNYRLLPNVGAAIYTVDKEDYGHLDAALRLDTGVLTTAKFGLRGSSHINDKVSVSGLYNKPGVGNGGASQANMDANYPYATWALPTQTFPGDYASELSGNFPRNLPRYDTQTLIDWGNANLNYDPVLNKNWGSSATIKEGNRAAYAMQEFEMGSVSGNAGLRWVRTEVKSDFYRSLNNNAQACPALSTACTPGTGTLVSAGAITSSRLTGYLPGTVENTYTNLLPSLNLRWDVAHNLIGRFSASRTLGRPNFSQLAGSLSGVNDTTLTASAGNPYLKPITSNNVDASLGWYYAPRAYVAGSIFTQHIHDYVKPGTSIQRLFDITKFANTKDAATSYSDYTVSSFSGKKAKLNGVELSAEHPIGAGFGLLGNVTYVSSKDEAGIPLVYTSKYTYNLRAIYEDNKFSASLAWNYRTRYSIGFSGNGVDTVNPTTLVRTGANYAAAQGSLSASVSYKLNDTLSLTLDGSNLLNPVRRYYAITEEMPLGFYANGRQFYLSLKARY